MLLIPWLLLASATAATPEFGYAEALPVPYADPVAELQAWAATRPAPQPVPPTARGYRFVGPALDRIAELAAERPGIARVEAFGRSATGTPLWAVHVRDPGTEVREEVLVFAGIHALEWISTEVALHLLEELIERPPHGIAVTVVPVLNPDGRGRVEDDLVAGVTHRYHRGNAEFVDLNRDYTSQRRARAVWRHLIPGYYASSPGPLSQPESQALDGLLTRHDYTRAASLHAFGGYLYHPWAGAWERPEHWRSFVRQGRQMEKAMGGHAYRTRQLSRWGFFFRAHGTELDHLYEAHGVQAWLVELTRSGLRPWRLAADRKTPFRWYNPVDPAPHVRRATAALRELVAGTMTRDGTR